MDIPQDKKRIVEGRPFFVDGVKEKFKSNVQQIQIVTICDRAILWQFPEIDRSVRSRSGA
jgi:hypothetical protein